MIPMLTVGDRFPEYKARACIDLGANPLGEISNAHHQGKWAVYVFYPKDFTFVCPTELVGFAERAKEFAERDAVIVAGSTDNEHAHLAWRQSRAELTALPYPLINAAKLAADLGILDPVQKVALRATFIVDPHGTIQWVSVNNLDVGRNVGEVLRVLDAIQSDELCPCNWKQGEATLVAVV